MLNAQVALQTVGDLRHINTKLYPIKAIEVVGFRKRFLGINSMDTLIRCSCLLERVTKCSRVHFYGGNKLVQWKGKVVLLSF